MDKQKSNAELGSKKSLQKSQKNRSSLGGQQRPQQQHSPSMITTQGGAVAGPSTPIRQHANPSSFTSAAPSGVSKGVGANGGSAKRKPKKAKESRLSNVIGPTAPRLSSGSTPAFTPTSAPATAPAPLHVSTPSAHLQVPTSGSDPRVEYRFADGNVWIEALSGCHVSRI